MVFKVLHLQIEDYVPDEFVDERSLCYYVMNSGMVKEEKVMFISQTLG